MKLCLKCGRRGPDTFLLCPKCRKRADAFEEIVERLKKQGIEDEVELFSRAIAYLQAEGYNDHLPPPSRNSPRLA